MENIVNSSKNEIGRNSVSPTIEIIDGSCQSNITRSFKHRRTISKYYITPCYAAQAGVSRKDCFEI